MHPQVHRASEIVCVYSSPGNRAATALSSSKNRLKATVMGHLSNTRGMSPLFIEGDHPSPIFSFRDGPMRTELIPTSPFPTLSLCLPSPSSLGLLFLKLDAWTEHRAQRWGSEESPRVPSGQRWHLLGCPPFQGPLLATSTRPQTFPEPQREGGTSLPLH